MPRQAMRCVANVLCLCAAAVSPLASAAVVTQTQAFSFNHAGSVSSGLISIGGLFTNAQASSPPNLSFARFNPALGRLTQADVTVTTTTATFAIQPTGVLSLATGGTVERKLAYTVTAGTTTGGDSATNTAGGSTLLTLLGLGFAEIGGAAMAKTTQFTAPADLAQLSGTGSLTVGLTATNTLSVVTLVSVLNGAGFTGSGTYAGNVSVTYTYVPWAIRGSVYNDVNHNGARDAGETGTGLTLFAKLVDAGNPTGPALQAVPVNPATGQYAFDVAFGLYRIVIDDNATLADVTPTNPAGWTATQASPLVRNGVVVAGDLANQDFGLVHATTACGRVFRDDGAGGGIANDGVINGTEAGIATRTLQLLNAGNAIVDTTLTAVDGSYCLYIPAATAGGASLRIRHVGDTAVLATGASVGTSAGTYARASETLSWSHVAAQGYTGLNFGLLAVPTLSTHGALSGAPGTDLWFAHRYHATSTGQVSFSTSQNAEPAEPGWTVALFRDLNSNGLIDPAEPLLAGPVAVTAGSTVPLLLRVSIPGGTPAGARLSVTLHADMTYTNAAPPLHMAVTTTDQAEVLPANMATLQLTKTVDKQSVTPGSTLVYTLVFTNLGSTPLNNLVINDVTPAHTRLVSTTALSIPASLGALTTTAPGAGSAGALRWSFAGHLMPSASGSVQFTVQVNP